MAFPCPLLACRLIPTYAATIIIVIEPMTLIVLVLAAMRLTRLGVWDKITMPARKVIIVGFHWKIKKLTMLKWKGSGTDGWLTYLAHCVFCAGFYASALVVFSNTIWPHNKWLEACYLTLAVAEVAPRLLNWEPRSNTGGE